VSSLADDPALRTKLGDRGIKYADLHFDRDAVLARISRYLSAGDGTAQIERARDPLQNDVVV
jgi:hypothetical protein